MPSGPKEIEEKLKRLSNTWETMAPAKTFGGMTLAEFQTGITPSFTARDRIADLNDQITQANNDRDRSDEVSLQMAQRLVNGVLADATEGPNSSLYEGFGYTRKSERRSGLTRKGKKTTPGSAPPRP
jgi:hypothetical protein